MVTRIINPKRVEISKRGITLEEDIDHPLMRWMKKIT
jgi:hypothetical protein